MRSALLRRRGLYQAPKEKGPCGPFPFTSLRQKLHVHATHAAHVGHAVAVAAALLLFHQLRDHRVGGEHQAGYGRGVLQRGASDLGRVDHAHLHQIAELLGLRVEAEVTLVLEHLVEHHRRLGTGVVDDDAQRLFERFHHDLDAGLLVVVVALELAFQHLLGADEGHTAARDDALFDRRAGRMQCVLDAGLLFLHLDFGRGAHLDQRYAACKFCQALLQLFLVVIAGRLFDLHADLLDPRLDGLLVARTVDEGRVFLGLSTFLTRPRSFRVTFSSVRPSSSEITVPPVSTAISSSIALRRSPKPGALTARVLRMPRKLLTTSVASASPSTSSAMSSSGLPALATCSRIGSRSRIELIFLSYSRIYGSSSTQICFSGLLMK